MTTALDKPRLRALYRRMAPTYDWWAALTESCAHRALLDAAELRDGQDVLEVAVGTGTLFAELLRRNPHGHTCGVDLVEHMVTRARAKAARSGPASWSIEVGDAYALDFDDDRFDVVVASYLLDLLPDEDVALVVAELVRVTKPGGRIVVAAMAPGERWYHRLWAAASRLWPSLLGGCRPVRLHTRLVEAGLVDVRVERVRQMTLASEVVYGVAPSQE